MLLKDRIIQIKGSFVQYNMFRIQTTRGHTVLQLLHVVSPYKTNQLRELKSRITSVNTALYRVYLMLLYVWGFF